MKKFILSLVVMITTVMSANAQKTFYGNNKFWDNWSVGTDGGIVTNLHDWDTPNGGVWGIQFTKAYSPVFSLEFSSTLGFNDNANWNIPHSANAVDNVNALVSGKVNLANLIWGYKGTPRFFEVAARGGVGYQWGFYPGHDNNINSGVGKLGLDFDFNLGKQKAWTLSVRPAVVLRTRNGIANCDYASNCDRYSHNAVGQLTCGVTYHFKGSNGKHHYTAIEPMVVEKIVEKPVERVVERVVEKTVEVASSNSDKTYVVGFAQNSAVLTDEAKATLDKVPQNAVVSVAGATSPEGTVRRNTALAQERADAVAAYLKGRGVNVKEAKGAENGRVAVVTID